MRLRAFLCALAVSAPCALTTAHVALAQASADDATTRAARARFEEGVRFFDKGDYENARAAFLQAYVLKKHPAVLLNLALSCQKGNHPLEASKYFQQFLRDSSQLSEAKRSEAERGLADVRTKLGRVEIVAAPGSEIFVSGERVGNAPLKDAVDVDPGSHVVSAKSPEGVTTEQKVSTSAGQKVTVKLGEAARSAEPVPAPVVTPPPKAEPPAAEPPPAPQVQDPPEAEPTKKKSLLSPPDNMVPVYIGLGVGGLGLIGTIGFAAAKGSAQSSVDSVEAQIRQKRSEEGASAAGTCVNPTTRYANACATLKDNLDKVDSNATLANVSAVVMVLGFVGAGAFYLFGPKTHATEGAKPAGAKRALPPLKLSGIDGWLGGETRGVVLRGTF
ncbi:MAG: hypothetical protein U0174_07805 [Polyangiaceae bacterium]